MDAEYRRDLSHTTWERVYARQMERADLIPAWLDALQVEPGMRVLDVGAGPGYVSFQAAGRVGPTGLVYAVDRSAEAMAYLEEQQRAAGIAQVRPIVADAATLGSIGVAIDAALVTMMLHHVDDPVGLLTNVARLLRSGARAVVAEFDPNGPCEVGPPRAERLAQSQVQAWCETAGFEILRWEQQSPEHYMLLLQPAPR